MAQGFYGFNLTYDGAHATEGRMNARVFTTAVGGLDSAYREVVLALGAFETEGLQVDGHIRHNCLIINFLASDEFRRLAGPLVQNRESIEALKLLLEAIGAAGDIALKTVATLSTAITSVPAFKVLRENVVQKKLKTAFMDEQLSQARLETELKRIALRQAQTQASDYLDGKYITQRELHALSDPVFLERALPALAQVILPLITGDATSVSLKGDDDQSPAFVTADALAPVVDGLIRTHYTQEPGAAHYYSKALPPEDRKTGVVTFAAVQFDRRKSGWRVNIEGHERAARIMDAKFRNDVATGSIIIVPNVEYVITYRERLLKGGLQLDILAVDILQKES